MSNTFQVERDIRSHIPAIRSFIQSVTADLYSEGRPWQKKYSLFWYRTAAIILLFAALGISRQDLH